MGTCKRWSLGRETVARVPGLFVLVAMLSSSPAHAQADNQAAARALFDEGRRLMKANQYEEACKKLEAASKLYTGSGVLLNLGDCYEHIDRTASAWVVFGEAAAAAERTSRPGDEAEGKRRRAALEPKLAHLVVRVPKSQTGLVVSRDGTVVDPAAWGVPIPVDPGTYAMSAAAPNKTSWNTAVIVPKTPATVTIDVPELADAKVDPTSPTSTGVVATSTGSGVRLVDVKLPRPDFASTGDKFQLRDGTGKVVCADLPCATKIPVKDNGFTMQWHPADGGSVVNAFVNDPGPGAPDGTLTGAVRHTKGSNFPAVAAMAGAGVLEGITLYVIVLDSNFLNCSYTGQTIGGTGGPSQTKTTGGRMFGGCPEAAAVGLQSSATTSSGLSGSGTVEVAVMALGGVVLIAGGVMLFTGWGARDALSVTVGAGPEGESHRVASGVTLRLLPGGIGGTF